MIIYGAGMAGLMAGHHFRRFNPSIFEAQYSLPNNHAALLRFRSDAVSRLTNIPFKKVKVHKIVAHAGKLYDKPNMKLSNMYSQKVTGRIMPRSIDSLEPVERYIAPENFIEYLAKGMDIAYNCPLTHEVLEMRRENRDNKMPVISTVPMNVLMDLVDWPDKPEFNYLPIWSVWGKLNKPSMNIYNTVYYPDYSDDYYRISITGDIVIAEYSCDPMKGFDEGDAKEEAHNSVINDLGICLAREFGIHTVEFESLNFKHQKYGKLIPIDDKIRKAFILYMTDKYRVYSLGRFSTWRQILMDDVVRDLSIIESMIENRDDYSRKLFSVGG